MICKGCGSTHLKQLDENRYECAHCLSVFLVDTTSSLQQEEIQEEKEVLIKEPLEEENLEISVDINQSVVRITTLEGHGTGFFISPTLIVTNAHVVSDETIVSVFIENNPTRYDAEVIAHGKNMDLDLALIEIMDYDSKDVLKLSSNPPNVLDEIIVVGNPVNLGLSYAKGIISRVTDKEVQLDVSVNPGNSGGPVLNDHKEVVGVVSYLLKEAQGTGFAIALNALKQFIDKSINKGEFHV